MYESNSLSLFLSIYITICLTPSCSLFLFFSFFLSLTSISLLCVHDLRLGFDPEEKGEAVGMVTLTYTMIAVVIHIFYDFVSNFNFSFTIMILCVVHSLFLHRIWICAIFLFLLFENHLVRRRHWTSMIVVVRMILFL